MKYPHSLIGKHHIRKSDLQRDLDEALHSLEAGYWALYKTPSDLREISTEKYERSALPVFVVSTGLVYKWYPNALLPDDDLNVIRPAVGPSATGPGRCSIRRAEKA